MYPPPTQQEAMCWLDLRTTRSHYCGQAQSTNNTASPRHSMPCFTSCSYTTTDLCSKPPEQPLHTPALLSQQPHRSTDDDEACTGKRKHTSVISQPTSCGVWGDAKGAKAPWNWGAIVIAAGIALCT